MNNICMCEKHKLMIKNLGLNDLIELSNQQSTLIFQLDELINGLHNPIYDFAAELIQDKVKPLANILQSFKEVRDNANNILDIVKDEIKIRLDESPSPRFLQGSPWSTVPLSNAGTVQYTKVKKHD